jgi:predicted double-glycine peptidase
MTGRRSAGATALPAPLAGVRLSTRQFRQNQGMCGPACLRIVFAYFGAHISETVIARACQSSPATGTTGANLAKAAGRFGFDAQVIDRSNLRTVERWLRKGVPVIVDWMSTVALGPSRTPMACGHYSVVCGLDAEHIELQDPAAGRRRRILRKHFLNVWFDFRLVSPRNPEDLIIRRLIVVTPAKKLRASARKRSMQSPSGAPASFNLTQAALCGRNGYGVTSRLATVLSGSPSRGRLPRLV